MEFFVCVTVGGGDGNTSNSSKNNVHYLALTIFQTFFQIILLLGPYHKSRKVVMSVQSICHCVGFKKNSTFKKTSLVSISFIKGA